MKITVCKGLEQNRWAYFYVIDFLYTVKLMKNLHYT